MAQYTINLYAKAENDEELETFLEFAKMLVQIVEHTTYTAELVEPTFDEAG